MPGQNILKNYVSEGYYHIYNRGVEKRDIFLEEKDYYIFHKYLFEAVSKNNMILLDHVYVKNHFHLLIFQNKERDIEKMMRSACIRYVLYFNFKYGRVGHLFQGRYKARLLSSLEDLTTIRNYFEKNRRDDLGLSL